MKLPQWSTDGVPDNLNSSKGFLMESRKLSFLLLLYFSDIFSTALLFQQVRKIAIFTISKCNKPHWSHKSCILSDCAQWERELAEYMETRAKTIINSSGTVSSFRLQKNNLLRKAIGTFITPYKVNRHF